MHLPALGEMQPTYVKTVPCASAARRRRRFVVDSSERLDDREDHDPDQEHRRYFIDNSIESLRMPILVTGELAYAANKESVQGGESENQDHLRLQPAGEVGATGPCKPQAKHPAHHHGGSGDHVEEPPLHDLESLRLPGVGLGLAMIDEKTRQIEHSPH